jgi:hypothetical protein
MDLSTGVLEVDINRMIGEKVLACGRALQSPHTGFIHYCYQAPEEERSQTIPLIENFLFCLALFKTKTAETITEAKVLLDRLLHFQGKDQEQRIGNFPVYLHDYPVCKDRYLGLHLLQPVYWILKDFSTVLGSDLRQRLEKCAKELLIFAAEAYQERPGNYLLSIKLGALLIGYGVHFQNAEWREQGLAIWPLPPQEDMQNAMDATQWSTPAQFGEILCSLQIAWPSLEKSMWNAFWQYLAIVWQRKASTFIGPSLKEFQDGLEPQVTLTDICMGALSGSFSKRALFGSRSCHLQAALLHHFQEPLPAVHLPCSLHGLCDGQPFFVYQCHSYGYSIIEKRHGVNPLYDKGFSPFKLVWGSLERAHSLVFQGGNCRSMSVQRQADQLEFDINLGDPIGTDDLEKNREVPFYLDHNDDVSFLVDGLASDTFHLGQSVQVKTKDFSITLKFFIKEGEGTFLGHIMPGNRLSQIALKGNARYTANDWQIFLRTIRRSPVCRIGVLLSSPC